MAAQEAELDQALGKTWTVEQMAERLLRDTPRGLIGWVVLKTIHTSGGDIIDVLEDMWESRADAARAMEREKADAPRHESFSVHPVGRGEP